VKKLSGSAKESGDDNSTRSKADCKGKRQRRRLGPDAYPDDPAERVAMQLELGRQAEASGDLVVDMPATVVRAFWSPWHDAASEESADGAAQPVEAPVHRQENRWCRPEVDQLGELSQWFVAHAREHEHAEAAAVGHILAAVHAAILNDDLDTLNAAGGPHTWARRDLRDNHGEIPLAIEDANHRLMNMDNISGGFRMLADVLVWGLKATRAENLELDQPAVVEKVAAVMFKQFPSLPSLFFAEELSREQFRTETKRIARQLRAAGLVDQQQPLERRARDIAQGLLETEFRASGKSDDIRRAFKFRDHEGDAPSVAAPRAKPRAD
jgi:hypothetical protein